MILPNLLESISWHNFLNRWDTKKLIFRPIKPCFRQGFDPEEDVDCNKHTHFFACCGIPAWIWRRLDQLLGISVRFCDQNFEQILWKHKQKEV